MQIELLQGDITKIAADAIVNAANSSLLGGGGVDGAIHRAGGPEILAECENIRDKIGICRPGNTVKTNAGKLKAKYIFHTVGPVWQGGKFEEVDILRQCYMGILKIADENKCGSIAIPNISTGIYGFPKELAAKTVHEIINEKLSAIYLKKVIFVIFDNENYAIYKKFYNVG